MQQDIIDLSHKYMEDYAQEVILNRAIPDIRDGLKPVIDIFFDI